MRNNGFACLVMMVLIIVGTLGGSHNSLMGMRKQAEAVFSLGVGGDGIGIQGDLRERSNAAYNLVVIARRYLPEENSLIQNVLRARTAMDSASTVKEKAFADKEMETAVRDLFDVLNGMSLSATDARFPQSLYTDFRSRGDTISHDPYNRIAADFNKTLSGFPANVLGGLTGVKPLDLYE